MTSVITSVKSYFGGQHRSQTDVLACPAKLLPYKFTAMKVAKLGCFCMTMEMIIITGVFPEPQK